MSNIKHRDGINKEDAYKLWWQVYSRVTGAGAVLTAMRETFGTEDLELTLNTDQKGAHEALASLGEWAAFDSLEILHDLFKLAELWERRAKSCGFGSEPAPPAPGGQAQAESEQGRAEGEEERRDRVRTELEAIRLIIRPDMPLRAVKTARQLLEKFLEKSEGEE